MNAIEVNAISIKPDNDHIMKFKTDQNGDYYFTLFSIKKEKYNLIIDKNDSLSDYFENFILQEIKYMNEYDRTPYFIISNDSVKIYDQNSQLNKDIFVKFKLLKNMIEIEFSETYLKSIRITAIGRMDHYPFFVPVVELFESIQATNEKKYIKEKKV